jgi:hypothetical protein
MLITFDFALSCLIDWNFQKFRKIQNYSLLFKFQSRGRMKKLSTRYEVSASNFWVRNVKTSEVGQKCQSRL